MKTEAGHTFGLIGPLAAFPLRLVSREAERRGHRVRRGVQRRASHLVIGRRLLASADGAVDERLRAALDTGRTLLSENGFLRELELLEPADGRTVDAQSMLAQSRLAEADYDILRLFDAFECDSGPFTFRDLILAKKYAGLIANGAGPLDIARSVQRSASVASLASKTLHADRKGGVLASFDEGLGELSGQLLFDLGGKGEDEEEAFADAEALEEDGRYLAAAELYRRCLALDPRDAVAAFNRANCLRAAGRPNEAATDYLRALKIDPSFAEAWFNLADLKADQDQPDEARRCLQRAIALDADYADAIYNLARLEFEMENLEEAKRLWQAYLKLDGTSEWARTAMRGIQYADLHSAKRSAG